MTVTTTDTKKTLPGNGVADEFSFSPIVIFQSSDLFVVRTDALGVETTLVEGVGATNYAVVVDEFPGTGFIRYPASAGTPLPTGESVTIKRVLPLTQLTSLSSQGPYNAKVQERVFDRLLMVSLQQQEEIDRTFKFPLSYSGGASAEIPVPAALNYLRWNAAATALENAAVLSTGTAVFPGVSTDNGLARFSGTSGKELQNSGVTVDDSNNVNIPGALTLGTALAIAQGGTGGTTASAARTNLAVPGLAIANTFTETQTWTKGSDVASDSALTLGAGNYFDITGTTAITSIVSKGVGTTVKLHFDAALTLTHHATDLILPGGADITTVAGDEFEFTEYAAGNWRCTGYALASGQAVVSSGGVTRSSIATTSGATVDITGLPAGLDEIIIAFDGVSHAANSQNVQIQLGDSGGFETTGYAGNANKHVGASTHAIVANSSGFQVTSASQAADVFSGEIRLTRVSGNIWSCSSSLGINSSNQAYTGAGIKTLSDELTQVRLTTSGGSDTFDAGTMYLFGR